MKVTVTHLKAPWPAGAVVGSVVELPGDAIPGWATGKCKPAEADAEASHVWEPPAPAVEVKAEAPKADDAEALKIAQSLLEAEKQAGDEARALLQAANAQVEALTTALAEANAKLAEAAAKGNKKA